MARGFQVYLAKKVLYVAVTVFLILTFNFLLFRVMPGDVARVVIPKGATPDTVEYLTDYYGLDEPLVVQYVIYLKQTLTGDFGESISFLTGTPIADILGQ